MGSVQSRNSFTPNNIATTKSEIQIIITTSDDSDVDEDEFVDCSSEFILNDTNNFNLDGSNTISHCDEIEKNPKPLERSSSFHSNNENDDETIAKIFDNKQTTQRESDDDEDESNEERKERQRKELEEFREEINRKREFRQQCIKKLREELMDLREKLANEVMSNQNMRELLERRGSDKSIDDLVAENKRLKIELSECQMYLQTSNSENINTTLENQALRDHVRSLKEVIKATKEMLQIRQEQVNQLKTKLSEIESSFAERETKIMSTALQQEYQKQLENIRNMRELYEERAHILIQERNSFKQQLDDKEHDLKTEIEKSKNHEEYIATLENNVKLKNTDISMLENEIGQLKSEKAQIGAEMQSVNQLISEVLFGFNASGGSIDIDKLYSMLEQNRDLLNEMAIKEDYAGIDEGSFLPKLLYDLFLQVNQNSNVETLDEVDKSRVISSPEEIASKLPKVWRVLTELLNHHNKLNEEEERVLDDCYKSINTATGTQSVLSVSKTFIKLRDLILEKKSLQKDTTRLKTLYSHLEQRLDKQEKRLSSVSLELTKTWHLVGKIKRQHRQLHTHEQILCYQLQQKRRLLNELKAELEYCRNKWAMARAINNESEEQCRQMRHEFSLRKIQDQNSAESGYSDEHASDDDDANKNKTERFDNNLSMFDRNASPTYSERRRSESPMLHDFSSLCLFSRAQSEPPQIFDRPFVDENEERVYEEVLINDTAFQPEQLESCIAVEAEEVENIQIDNISVVTLPPEVLEYDKENPPKVKTRLRKNKKDKRKRKDKKTESAEDMYMRLMASINGENSTSSTMTSTAEDDDHELDNIEEIPLDTVEEIPFDATAVEIQEKVPEINDESPAEPVEEIIPENLTIVTDPIVKVDEVKPPVPSTSEDDYLKRREARLQRLEKEAKEFYDRMARDKEKRAQLDNHLSNVHQNFLDRQKERTKLNDESSGECSSSINSNDTKNADEQKRDQNDDENDEHDES